MNIIKRYNIPFGSLKEGKHSFEFIADSLFFEAFEGSEVSGGDIKISVTLTKGSSVSSLDFEISGTAVVKCDRCLEDCSVPVDFSGTLMVKPSHEQIEYDGETMWVGYGENSVNAAQYIYESIVLSLPYTRVHSNEGTQVCDPKMVSRIVDEQDLAREDLPGAEKEEVNPQWAKLQELKDKL